MSATVKSSAPADTTSVSAEFPTTLAQRRHWAQAKRAADDPRGDPTINIAARWRVEGSVVPALLEKAIRVLIERHEILRTRFVERNGVLVQQVLPETLLRVHSIDLTALPEAERSAAAERLGREEAARPFDVSCVPLFRVTLLCRSDNDADLLLTTHYLVSDCWSNFVLVKELGNICDAMAAGRTPELPELPLQFGDFAAWQHAWLEAGGDAVGQAYWARQLAKLPEAVVPVDYAPPHHPTKRGDVVRVATSTILVEAAAAKAMERGATFFTLGVATLAAVLHRWTGRNDIVFGSQIAGRDDVDLEDVVGPLVNTLVLRHDCSGDLRFSELLDAARLTVGEALEHSTFPVERLNDVLDLRDSPRRSPVDSVSFMVLHRGFLRDAAADGFALKGIPSLSPGAKHDINLYLVERTFGWRVQCEYDPDLFKRATVERLVDAFVGVLAAVVADPDQRLSVLPVPHFPSQASATQHTQRPVVALATPAGSTTDDVGARLKDIWAEILERQNIMASDNFFALGGNSLRAARMLTRVEGTFGRNIGLAQFFRAPTLGAMTDLLRPGGAPARGIWTTTARQKAVAPPLMSPGDKQIVELRPAGARTTIIGINSVGILHALTRDLHTEHGLVAVRLFEPEQPSTIGGKTLEAIASDYLAAIRKVQPAGPYALFGLCVHGVLAYEIAQQLRRGGEQVELLAVKNMWHPTYFARLSSAQRWRVRLAAVRDNLRQVRAGEKSFAAFLGNYRLARRSGVLHLAKMLRLIDAIPSRTGAHEGEEFLLDLMAARDAYRPSPYDGPVLQLVGADQLQGHGFDPTLGWSGVMTGKMFLCPVEHPEPSGPDDIGALEMASLIREAFESVSTERVRSLSDRIDGDEMVLVLRQTAGRGRDRT